MNFILDTSTVISVLRNRPPLIRQRLNEVSDAGHSISVPAVVIYELWYGVTKSPNRERESASVETFLEGNIEVLPFDADTAAIAGQIRTDLERRGMRIGAYDILIAAHAVALGGTLVTSNQSEFSRVEGLVWQDWTA